MTSSSGSTPARPLRVLVVDDNVDAATSLAMVLRLDRHDVRMAHDGPSALELCPTFQPEVVLLDIGLPRGMDGYEVARRLRQQPVTEKVLLVAMTGWGNEEDQAQSQAAGFDRHLVKPVDPLLVRQLLTQHPRP